MLAPGIILVLTGHASTRLGTAILIRSTIICHLDRSKSTTANIAGRGVCAILPSLFCMADCRSDDWPQELPPPLHLPDKRDNVLLIVPESVQLPRSKLNAGNVLTCDNGKSRRATLIDVAKLAGVSRATASLVIRNSPLVASDTRIVVEKAIETLGYIRNLTAARLRAGQTRVVGLVIPNLTNPFFAELLAGVEEVLEAEGLAVLLANSHDDPLRQNEVMHRMREHGVDGFLICPAMGTLASTLEGGVGRLVPTVQVLRYVTEQMDYVGADYRGGMEQAVNHLANLGHRRIAFAVQGGKHSAYLERLNGFEAAMRRSELDPELIIELPSSLPEVAQQSHRLLDDKRSPTATICFNDIIAFGLSGGLQDLKVKLGEEHSLVGFDDVMHGETIRPRLTSVATHPVQIGRRSAEQLLMRLIKPESAISQLTIETKLQIRQSSGAPMSR